MAPKDDLFRGEQPPSRQAPEVYHYLEAWSDEMMPCEPALDAWAKWLSEPDNDWGRPEPAKHGETFRGFVMTWLGDVEARWVAGDWVFDPSPLATADHFFVRHGPGLGWDAEQSGNTPAEALDCLASIAGGGDTVTLACVKDGPQHLYRYELAGDQPRLVDVGPVQ